MIADCSSILSSTTNDSQTPVLELQEQTDNQRIEGLNLASETDWWGPRGTEVSNATSVTLRF